MNPTITIEASPELEELTDRVLKRFEEITAALEQVEKKCDEVIGALNRADTEQNGAEPKRGKWIYKGARGRFPVCECSVCGNEENCDWAILGDNVNYCPNCGAKMEMSEE